MKLSVLIPAYNEENRLGATLNNVKVFFDSKAFSYEIIVVNDGSSDKTAEIAKLNAAKLIEYKENMGKGYAVKKGVEAATGDYILFLDADNATPVEEFEKLFIYMENADIAIGSRYLPNSKIERGQSFLRVLIGRAGNFLIQFMLLPKIKDTQCGFKLFKAEIAKELFSHLQTYRFGFDIEILARASRKKYQIAEVPVTWLHNSESRVRPLRDALRTFFDLLKISWVVKL